jgi:class 3 adenylate cyclase/CheY-like chemotaxis protein
MSTQPDNRRRVLVVDDERLNVEVLVSLLRDDYRMMVARNGEQALKIVTGDVKPDLVLLDVMMPDMDGFEVCRRMKELEQAREIPVVFVSAMGEEVDEMRGLAVGGVDYITKPISPAIVQARVRTHLSLYDHARRLKDMVAQLEAQANELAAFNEQLEQRVRDGVAEVARLGRLKRFFSPSVADLLLTGGEDPLRSHRREIAVVFLDLRGFTAFTETADPEEVMGVLREYHRAMGELIQKHDGTLERFAGDGIMIFFNDPVVIPDPAARAVRMAREMQTAFQGLYEGWRRRGYDLAMGIGIAQGYATIGAIGFEGRQDYGAIGTVCNLAARLCSEAKGGQILISQRVRASLDDVPTTPVGELSLKGFHGPVPAFLVG